MSRSVFIANPLLALATTGFAMSLTISVSACQPTVTDNGSTGNTDTPVENQDWSCQSQTAPFAYSVCRINANVLAADEKGNTDYSLQLFWQQSDHQTPLLTFDNVLSTLSSSKKLAFAMNAGMYNEHYAPIGYTVIEGKQIRALNTKEGGGNFHLLPNGVMWWDKMGKVQITDTQAMQQQLNNGTAKPWFATQSGPMLVIDNEIHPKFNADGTSLKFRNGAGVCDDGNIQFVNSDEPVSFYQFATLFKDNLGCPNALFLDGGIASALYAPTIDTHDKTEMGVMIGVIEHKH